MATKKKVKRKVSRIAVSYKPTDDQPPVRQSTVESPNHYKIAGMNIEAVDVMEATHARDAHVATALIYLLRAGRKDDISYVEDLAKARWWITRAINFHGGHPEVPKK